MLGPTILISGIVSNEARNLDSEINSLAAAFSFSKNVYWHLVESDSNDLTIRKLQAIENNRANFSYISLGNLKQKFPRRTERLAYCRNQYLNFFMSNKLNYGFDFLVVADFDGTNKHLDVKSVQECFDSNQWSAFFATQKYFYYDLWALRSEVHLQYDVYKRILELISQGNRVSRAYFRELIVKMYSLSHEHQDIRVQSAFGGLAIYNSTYIPINAEYIGIDSEDKQICEHVSFNRAINRMNGEMFIKSRMRNHKVNSRVWESIFQWIVYLILPNRIAKHFFEEKFERIFF